MKDIFFMKRAIYLAQKGIFNTAPNPNVGCVIVNNKKIVGEGWHQKAGDLHAEIIALKSAGIKSKGSTMYVTLEPCSHFGKTPPCCKYIIQSQITRVVIAVKDPNPINHGKGIKWLSQSGIQVKYNLLALESKKINKGFFKRMITGYPYTQLKLACSLDGRTATENGDSKWITSSFSRQDVHKFRAQSSAILSTSSTVLKDNPLLTVRNVNIEKTMIPIKTKYYSKLIHQPTRIIIDSQNQVKPFHNCINIPGKVILARLHKDNESWPTNVKQILLDKKNDKIYLKKLFLLLGKLEFNIIWVESGPTLAGLLLQYHLVDELIVYISPKLLGHKSKPLLFLDKSLSGLSSNFLKLIFTNVQTIGSDIRLTLKPIYQKKSFL
ncbi:bifunctional diaminohydroxyphosphoribosylaminopyrimidine deaminase/5-amino-6-(5-phosphoribosylamino)uracil reductase RibD [Buchnera aphidicola (Hormaphis cornu)]|nr:bifunctional diaminohydroxyphosphoribosylaminopyrimidine deaminase/5-amino-6-(5-phosphoribosylamino)uracil reductase RibD [Buchnera aphidicola (Hormaphis cornu)]